MAKFNEMLAATGGTVLKKRADQVSKMVEMEQKKLVYDLQTQRYQLENQLESLTDLSVKSQDSLVIGSDSFNASAFIGKVQQIKMEIRKVDIQLQEAQKTLLEWFDTTA